MKENNILAELMDELPELTFNVESLLKKSEVCGNNFFIKNKISIGTNNFIINY